MKTNLIVSECCKAVNLAFVFASCLCAHAHDYGSNGVCTESGCTAPYQEPELKDGWYQLANAGNVEWFSALVNAGGNDTNLCGCLTADIDFTGVKHTPIGAEEGTKFNGKFDGMGHRIMNLRISGNNNLQGFFGGLRGGGTVVRNLIMDKSCRIAGKQRVGGIAAFAQTTGSTPILIENCINEATVTGSGTAVGGILGGSMSPHPAIRITNCANKGSIRGSGESATIAGWAGDNAGTVVEYCYNTGRLIGMDSSNRNMVRHGGFSSARNLYELYSSSTGSQGIRKDWITSSPIESGELCYLLNQGQAEYVWRQALGEDAAPLPFGDSPFVYACGQANCDGTLIPDATRFSNTDEGLTTLGHDYRNGWCSICGEAQPGYRQSPRKVFLMAGQSNADGRPAINTMPQYIQDLPNNGGSRFCYWSYCNGTDVSWQNFGGKLLPYIPYTDNNTTSRCGFDGIVYHLIEQELQQRFYVIKESRGGTAIDTRCSSSGNLWWCADPGWLATASPRSGHSLALEFTQNIGLCIDNVLSALEEGYEIQCIMWHQGESDRTQASSYESNLRQLVAYLRSYLVGKTGVQHYATLPFIAGTVNHASTQYNAEVEASLYRLAGQDPDFHVVDMSDCKLGTDNLHFDATGCEDAAGRMFAKMVELGIFRDEADPVATVPATHRTADAACYDLTGRQIDPEALCRSLYIQNNRKVMSR